MNEKETSKKMQEIMMRMKERREELDMTYQTLSDMVGISKSTLQRYETGHIKNMPVDKLEDIADALNVSPSYLMGWDAAPDIMVYQNDVSILIESCPKKNTLTVHFDETEYTEEHIKRILEFAKFIKQESKNQKHKQNRQKE